MFYVACISYKRIVYSRHCDKNNLVTLHIRLHQTASWEKSPLHEDHVFSHFSIQNYFLIPDEEGNKSFVKYILLTILITTSYHDWEFFSFPICEKSPQWRPNFSNISLSIQKYILVGVSTKFTTDEEENKSFVKYILQFLW